MSLINDALKRASESDRKRPARAAMPPLMQPATNRPGPRNASLVVAIALAVIGLTTAWAIWKSWTADHHAYAAAPMQAVAAKPAPASPEPAPVVIATPVVTAAPVAAPVAPVAAGTPAPDPDALPTNLTVKAIFYSKTSPRALINESTVETGDRVNGVLITGISSNCVYVDWNGKTRELTLGRK
jgi:hypothetical protein